MTRGKLSRGFLGFMADKGEAALVRRSCLLLRGRRQASEVPVVVWVRGDITPAETIECINALLSGADVGSQGFAARRIALVVLSFLVGFMVTGVGIGYLLWSTADVELVLVLSLAFCFGIIGSVASGVVAQRLLSARAPARLGAR